jgi:hypothetical protein
VLRRVFGATCRFLEHTSWQEIPSDDAGDGNDDKSVDELPGYALVCSTLTSRERMTFLLIVNRPIRERE